MQGPQKHSVSYSFCQQTSSDHKEWDVCNRKTKLEHNHSGGTQEKNIQEPLRIIPGTQIHTNIGCFVSWFLSFSNGFTNCIQHGSNHQTAKLILLSVAFVVRREGLMMMITLPVVMIVSHDMRFAKPCIIVLLFF